MASSGTRQILYADRLESTIGTLLLIHDREGHLRALDFHDFAATCPYREACAVLSQALDRYRA